MVLPVESSELLPGAVEWIRSLLLGPAATIIAVLSVAALGLMMLSGRVPTRRGVRVVLGCFILFSAGGIANGIVAIGRSHSDQVPPPSPQPQPSYTPTAPDPPPNDPYAGAAVPNRNQGDILQ